MTDNPINIEEIRDIVENNILRFWLDNMQDNERGGFYGRMRGDGVIERDAIKGGVLNARILWSFSAAYRILGKEEYLAPAKRAKDYLLEYFFDNEYGGIYWSVDSAGRPADTKKQFYALGFALYGLTEYARATGDKATLDKAVELFDTIETHAADPVYGGYIEALSRTWKPLADVRLSDLDANYPKSQNTHLHILEPYTNLYRCLKERGQEDSDTGKRVEKALRGIINIFTDRILNPDTHHLDLFFNMDWTRGAGRRESYGHDIECSWLLHEAALTLGDNDVLARVAPVVRLVAGASEKGLNADGSMTHEADPGTGYVDDARHWWVQAEAVVGFYNIYQHFGERRALDIATHCLQYIKDNLVDYERGEWYWSRDGYGNINTRDDRAGFWKCPYHNSRMCLELIERINNE
ncbi:MAG: AGE family epimerase/isomerase [Prevotella sp.]|nr:AGE family epimerase/isomerase [Prevotella sp.]